MGYTIRISDEELKSRAVREIVTKLIDTKMKERRSKPFIEISKGELELIEKFLGMYLVPWKRYAKNKKELKYKNEIGKYNGKRVCVR